MARKKGWTCQRITNGKKCKHLNMARARKCAKCNKPRPLRAKPSHMQALALDYEGYIALNGGEQCGICGRKPSTRRRLDRDHDHKSGEARGLLCARCNRALPAWITPEWLRAALAYLDHATERLTKRTKDVWQI